ncbi:integrator complex subunit 5-like [Branchiostoma floridae x Branchiostoma japonicum]
MATTIGGGGVSAASHTPQELQAEIKTFVQGKHATFGHKLTLEEHARSALSLLRTVPAARSAVLEFLQGIFDEAVNSHILQIESEGSGTVGPNLDPVIQEVCSVLLGFVKVNPQAWAPLISAWSIDLLGQISTKYAGRRGVPHSSSLNELLQLWMTCKATRTLMDIYTQCLAAMTGSSADLCVDALLDTSVQHSPHFDWVVAHIGSSFPNTIITRVLSCGLKDFCSHSSSQVTESHVPKLASVVGILGHLAAHHAQDIREALLQLFHVSLSEGKQEQYTVPFLLELATMSPMLLRVITTELVDSLSADVLNQLARQLSKGRSKADMEGLISLVVHLITKTGSGCQKVLKFLLDTACPVDGKGEVPLDPAVQHTCTVILNTLVADLQKLVFGRAQQGDITEILFLSELQAHRTHLCQEMLSVNGSRQWWLVQILRLLGCHLGESCAADIVTFNLQHAQSQQQLGLLLELLEGFQCCLPDVTGAAVCRCMDSLQTGTLNNTQASRLLANIVHLLKSEDMGKRHFRWQLQEAILLHLQPMTSQLEHSCLQVAAKAMQIQAIVGLPAKPTTPALIHTCLAAVRCFFRVLHDTDLEEKITVIQYCKVYLSHLCGVQLGQTLVIRHLVKGMLDKENAVLFGAKVKDYSSADSSEGQSSLLQQNIQLGRSSTPTVFHAGVIGKGLRPKPDAKQLPSDQVTGSCQAVLDVLYTCTLHEHHHASIPKHEEDRMDTSDSRVERRRISSSGSRTLALLVVELVCPDVIQAPTDWPDEEFTKYTVERDLHITRKFKEHPILWDILKMVAEGKTALCHCAILLSSVISTLITHWEGSRSSVTADTPWHLQASCKALECMGEAHLLPAPLGYVSELFHIVTPYEVALLLREVWKFMVENPPSPELYSMRDITGRPIRFFNPDLVRKHLAVVLSILHSNIPKLGHLYSRFQLQ